MKKIVFFTAMLAFVAGSTIAVSNFDANVIETSVVEDGDDKDKKEKKSKDKDAKAEATATATTTKSKDCASKKACCSKAKKSDCKDKKKDK